MNYDSISRRLSETLPALTYRTVELAAEHVAQTVLSEFHAPGEGDIGKPGAVRNAALVKSPSSAPRNRLAGPAHRATCCFWPPSLGRGDGGRRVRSRPR